ncbi:glycosyltransferase family 9 protein [Candidatus Omnitrophota bacterium]
MKGIKKILIIGHTNIGDVAGNLIFITPLKKHFPQAQIVFLTSSRTQELVTDYKDISKNIFFDKHGKDKGLRGRMRLRRILRSEEFDLVVVLTKSVRHLFLGIPHTWNVRRTFAKEFKQKKTHPIDIYVRFLEKKGIEATIETNYSLDKEKQFCNEFLKKNSISEDDRIIGILPIANWAGKTWPVEYWNELAQRLNDSCGVRVIAFGKTNPSSTYDNHVLSTLSPVIISAINQTTIKDALALLQHCCMFIGPDSSLLHLASLLRIETIGLYGPTPHGYMYPYFHRDNLIGPKTKSEGGICNHNNGQCDTCNPGKPGICMRQISVDEVFDLVSSKLNH